MIPDPDRSLREEIRFHLEERARELEAEGVSRDEALRRARAAFGDPEAVVARVRREAARATRGTRGGRVVAELLGDLRYSLRRLARSPGFAAVATVTLALGIGANAAIFSLANALFFRAPPVRDPGALVAVYTTCRIGTPRCSSSYPDYLDYRERSAALADLAAYGTVALSLGDDGRGAELLEGLQVTGNYFDLLGVRPAAGRLLRPGDDVAGAPSPVAVASWDAWQRLFGGDPEMVGRTVRLNGAGFTIVGVAPMGFHGTALTGDPELFVPITAGGLLGLRQDLWEEVLASRDTRWIDALVGRLRPGATLVGLRQEMAALSAGLQERYPDERGGRTITVDPAARYTLPQIGAEGLPRLVGLLAGVVGVTLLLACANLANLLLARATGREQEMGVRLSLGAGRGRLLRQLLTEAVVLAAAGCAAGLLVARALTAALARFELPGRIGLRALDLGLDLRVLGFAAAIALATTLLFGLAPALVAARSDLAGAARGRVSRGPRAHRLRGALLALQVALCVVLLTGAGLFLRSLRQGLRYDLGFRPEGVAVARLFPAIAGYGPAETVAFVDRVLERVRRLPGVTDASVSSAVPLGLGAYLGNFAEVPGYTPAPDEEMRVELAIATPGFVRTMGMRVSEGAAFDEALDPERPVVLINRDMARRYWPDGALGRPVRLARRELAVGGVIDDPAWRLVPQPPVNVVVAPLAAFATQGLPGSLVLAVRTEGDPRALLPELRTAARAIDPRVPLADPGTLEERIASALGPQRLGASVLSAFALLALVLAATGIAGVVAYTVSQGRREIGIRLALGASRATVLAGAVGRVAAPVALGLAVGGAAALALGGTVRAFLLGVVPTDPIALAGGAAALVAVATAAALLPARRATRVDPVEVLRAE